MDLSIVVLQHLALQKLLSAINKEPDLVKAFRLFEQFQAATQNATSYAYTTIINTLNETMMEPQKDTLTKGKQLATKDTKLKMKPGPNNPEQAEAFSNPVERYS